jgi:G:T-mismatch repair DNA endonuclease (very short patch repair protein)
LEIRIFAHGCFLEGSSCESMDIPVGEWIKFAACAFFIK